MTRTEAEQMFAVILEHLGEDPAREGIRETPRRWLKAMTEMTQGNGVDIEKLLGVTFEAGSYDEIVLVRDITFSSMCEHHLLPFTGKAHVAYLPAEVVGVEPGTFRVVGLSKIPKLVDAFAMRLQLQEQMTAQIAKALFDALSARGVGVIVTAEHQCATCRGVRKAGMSMVTSVMLGSFRDDANARAELLRLLGV